VPSFRSKKLVNESMGPKPKTSQKTGIARKMAMGTPLVASASGVKGGRGANRAFGMLSGVTASKTGIKVDPLGVAMAVSPFKLGAVAKGLRAAGKIEAASQVEARLAAKTIGGKIAKIVAGGSTRKLGASKIIPGLRVAAEVRDASRPVFRTAESVRFSKAPGTVLRAQNQKRSVAASVAQSERWLGEHLVNPIEKRMAVSSVAKSAVKIKGKISAAGFVRLHDLGKIKK